jgi:hypothetical protein
MEILTIPKILIAKSSLLFQMMMTKILHVMTPPNAAAGALVLPIAIAVALKQGFVIAANIIAAILMRIIPIKILLLLTSKRPAAIAGELHGAVAKGSGCRKIQFSLDL